MRIPSERIKLKKSPRENLYLCVYYSVNKINWFINGVFYLYRHEKQSKNIAVNPKYQIKKEQSVVLFNFVENRPESYKKSMLPDP